MNLNKSELFSKVFINVLFFSVFITIFFFIYGSFIEKSVISTQMDILTTEITNNTKIFGSNFDKLLLKYVNNINLPDLSAQDHAIETSNKNIIKTTITANVILVIILIGIIYYIYKKSNNSIEINQIISDNLVILIFIALTEYSFLTFFGSKFISIDSNQTKLSLLTSLRNKFFK